ncbi:MAG TPA: 4-alpha-glucanotransferase [Planctomycetaceae bacterium]|jgi:4-alpha-glucanotransferase
MPRTAGILCHVTSLPGQFGIGDLGQAAYHFADWLAAGRQGLWQVLPLGPPGYGESPYQSYSAFAGNPLLVGLDRLVDEGWLSPGDLEGAPEFSAQKVDFEIVAPFREQLLSQAFDTFCQTASPVQQAELAAFRQEQSYWLNDYAFFAALKKAHAGEAWTQWSPAFVTRKSPVLATPHVALARAVDFEAFVQFQFHRQWRELKAYCNARGIRLMGDVPIFVAHDSADVWAHQELFLLDEGGHPTVVAGVPPDYFSATGQLWGNPLYRWETMRQDGFAWWLSRIQFALQQFDLIRLDHFRGFEAYWEVPAGAATAAGGRWVHGPGQSFFQKIGAALGEVPLVAEDLGVITPAVEALRDDFGFPGMRILQFAFGADPQAPTFQPHNFPRNCVVYTGTHDNDTTVGWFRSQAGPGSTRTAKQVEVEHETTLRYLGTDGREIQWDMIRLALASVADTAIVPLQDVLGLGNEARMNLPGTASGNWRWRCPAGELARHSARLADLAEIYGRLPQAGAS